MKHGKGGSYFQGRPLSTEQDYRLKFSEKNRKMEKKLNWRGNAALLVTNRCEAMRLHLKYRRIISAGSYFSIS